MTKDKTWRGVRFQDPMGFYLTPRRAWVDDPLLTKPYHEWMAWQWIVVACVYEPDGRDIYRKKVKASVHLERGQCLYSYSFMAEAWGWKSESRVRRFLDLLAQLDRITLSFPVVNRPAQPSKRLKKQPNTCQVLSRVMPGASRVTHLTRQLGQVITVHHYDAYQTIDFYVRPTGDGPTALPRSTRDSNSKEGEGKKGRSGESHTPSKLSTYPQAGGGQLPKANGKWHDIRASIQLGFWRNIPPHVQDQMVEEAIALEPNIPDDLRPLLIGEPSPQIRELMKVRDKLREGEDHE